MSAADEIPYTDLSDTERAEAERASTATGPLIIAAAIRAADLVRARVDADES